MDAILVKTLRPEGSQIGFENTEMPVVQDAHESAIPRDLRLALVLSSSAYLAYLPSLIQRQMSVVAALPNRLNPTDRRTTLQPSFR